MTELILLGVSNAIPTLDSETTSLAVRAQGQIVLIDCGSNPLVRLEQAVLDFNAVSDLILTHFHPDHVSGLPLFLMDLWLLGRTTPLTIHGLPYTLDRAKKTGIERQRLVGAEPRHLRTRLVGLAADRPRAGFGRFGVNLDYTHTSSVSGPSVTAH